MRLHEIKPVQGSRPRKRVGRGIGSGTGKTAGKGHNGQNSRTGGGVRLGFEGGQTPLFKRLPKRGFTNFTRKEYAIVNLKVLNVFEDGTVVTPELLIEKKIIRKILNGVKVLGEGNLEKKLTIKVHKATKSAVEKINSSGSTLEVI